MEDISSNNPVGDVSGNYPIETTPSKEEITVSGNDAVVTVPVDVSGGDAVQTETTVSDDVLSDLLLEVRFVNFSLSVLIFLIFFIWIESRLRSAVRNVVKK